MKKDTKYYEDKYRAGLDIIKRLGVVSREQASKLLGCHNDTLLILVSHKLLRQIKISRVDFYSTSTSEYRNRQIRRSVLLAQFYIDRRENIKLPENNKIDNSLHQKNVIYLGHTESHSINHYLILGVNNCLYTKDSDYKDLVNLVKEIYAKDGTERIRIYFLHSYSNFNYFKYEQMLFKDKELSGLETKIQQGITILSLKNVYKDIPALRYI